MTVGDLVRRVTKLFTAHGASDNGDGIVCPECGGVVFCCHDRISGDYRVYAECARCYWRGASVSARVLANAGVEEREWCRATATPECRACTKVTVSVLGNYGGAE